MNNPFRRAAILMGLCLCSVLANATLIEFVPADQTVDLGDQVLVDIVVTPDGDLSIAEFDFIVNYDATILSVFSVVFGNSLGDGLAYVDDQGTSFQDIFDFGSGMLNLAELSLLSELELDALQNTDSFVLASIVFDTLILGTSNLSFTGNIFGSLGFFGDAFFAIIPTDPGSGSITVVQPPVTVPEPPTWMLLIAGLLAVSLHRNKLHRNKM